MEIAYSELDNWLKSQSNNTPETAYELKITGLTKEDLIGKISIEGEETSPLGIILSSNPTKYVDLSETIFPEDTISLHDTFFNCKSLVKSPNIPNTVTDVSATFNGCTSLVEAPVVPEGVIIMDRTFSWCPSLVKFPIIPSTVTNMSGTFERCTSLVKAPVIPEGVTDMQDTFYNCTSLVKGPVIPSTVTYMSGTFEGCSSLKSLAFSNSKITNCYNVIDKQLDFIKFDYDLENVGYVKNMKTYGGLDAKLIITNDECLETIKDYFPNKNVHSISKWTRLV